MFTQGRIPTCREGLTLPPDSFCLADGTAASQQGLGLRASYALANFPDGTGLLLRGAQRIRVEGDMRLGWMTVERRGANRVITHLVEPPATITSITSASGLGSASGTAARTHAPGYHQDDGSEIDVMVIYTPLAKHLVGGRSAIEALIALYVAETNQVYENSGVVHRIRLVLTQEMEYVETGDARIDLRRLRDASDGYMDQVHELRDLYAADLVHLITGRSPGARAYASQAFGLIDISPGTVTASNSGLLFAHELGHNMGLAHDRFTIGESLTGSNHGYVNQRMFEPGAPASARWKTIMAYGGQCQAFDGGDCPSIPYFSNPGLTYQGDPLGVAADNPSTGVDGPADAARTLNYRRGITANFRWSSSSPTPRVALTLSQYWLAENGGVVTVTATQHRPSSADTVVTVLVSPADAVALSATTTLTIPAGQRTSIGAVTIAGVDNGDQSGDVVVTVSGAVANTSNLGVIAPEAVELVVADDETTPVVTLSPWRTEVFEGENWFERRIPIAATLDNRSSVDTKVEVSWSPPGAVTHIGHRWLPLLIPAGQTVSVGRVELDIANDTEWSGAERSVTVSGTATNARGVTGPETVTLTIIDDDAPIFADDAITYTFTTGIVGRRALPEAAYGNGALTYSLFPALSNGSTFMPGPPALIEVSSTSVPAYGTYTLTAKDADGDTDTMAVNIRVREGLCPNTAAVASIAGQAIVADCEVLLASMDAMRGIASLNWSTDLPMSKWQGVSIAGNRVVRINMPFRGLSGILPSELGSLTNLQSLDISSNLLTGPIPREFGDLVDLKTLRLYRNQLTGAIPDELGSLRNLERLDLSSNRLTGGIPGELGGLANLRRLDLGSNRLTGEIPTELGDLISLERLWLYRNRLAGEIPTELGSLAKLQSLNLDSNQLTGEIPTEVGSLMQLQSLRLRDNRLVGGIPAELGNLNKLEWLDLSDNWLTGPMPTELGNLHGLKWLDLGDNQLTGPLLAGLGGLTNLQALFLSGNQLIGSIPPELGALPNLRWLDLSGNRLTGLIPVELGSLTNLDALFFGGNRLTGCIPGGLRDVSDDDPDNDPDNDLSNLGIPDCAVDGGPAS